MVYIKGINVPKYMENAKFGYNIESRNGKVLVTDQYGNVVKFFKMSEVDEEYIFIKKYIEDYQDELIKSKKLYVDIINGYEVTILLYSDRFFKDKKYHAAVVDRYGEFHKLEGNGAMKDAKKNIHNFIIQRESILKANLNEYPIEP